MEKIFLSTQSLLAPIEKAEGKQTLSEWLALAVKQAVFKTASAAYLSSAWPTILYSCLPQSGKIMNANLAITALSEMIGRQTDVELMEIKPKTFAGDGASLQPVKVKSEQLPLSFDFLPISRSFSVGQSGIMESAAALEKGYFINLYKWALALLDVIFDRHELKQGMDLMTLRHYQIPKEAKARPCDWDGFAAFLRRFVSPQTKWDIKIEAATERPRLWNITCPQLAQAVKEA